MFRSPRPGHFQLCVDLGLESDQTALAQHRQLTDLTTRLLQVMERHRVPVTWAISETLIPRVAESARSWTTAHEVALLAESGWMAPAARREEVAQNLRQQLSQAEEHELPITSVVLRDVESGGHHELLARHGIDVVRSRPIGLVTQRAQRDPIAPKGGTWCVPATAVFPAAGRFLGRFDLAYRGKQVLWRSIQRQGTEHLAISAARMLRNPSSTLRSLERIVQCAARFQATGQLRCETLRDAARRWRPSSVAAPQRSILKPAA